MYTLFGFQGLGLGRRRVRPRDRPARRTASSMPRRGTQNDALAELERVNPLKQIPTLLLPGWHQVLTESAAILTHLGIAYPRTRGCWPIRRIERDHRAARPRLHRGELLSVHHDPRLSRALHDRHRRRVAGRRCADGTRARLHHHWDIFADLFPVEGRSVSSAATIRARSTCTRQRGVALGRRARARDGVAPGIRGAAGAHRIAPDGGAGVGPPLADGRQKCPRARDAHMEHCLFGSDRGGCPADQASRPISTPGARCRRLARPARSSRTVRASGQLDMRHGFMPATTLVTTPSALRNTTSTGWSKPNVLIERCSA